MENGQLKVNFIVFKYFNNRVRNKTNYLRNQLKKLENIE